MTTTNDSQFPASWGTIRLGELTVHKKGKKPRKQSPNPSTLHPIPYIDIRAFEEGVIRSWTNGLDCRICRDSELLMVWDGARSGLVGKGKNGALGSTLVSLDFPLIENQYAFYFFQLKYQEINSRTKGSGTPHVDPHLLWSYEFPVPPLPEQRRIVAKIEKLFSELDKGIESLKAARAKLDVYRQAVLKHAFEGKLTAQWREENKDKLETPGQLLARIKQEREARYEQQLQEWKTTVKAWDEGGRSGKKPTKPKPLNDPSPISQEDRERLLDLPDRWAWVRFGQLFSISPQNGIYKPASVYGSGTQIIRIDDFYDGRLTRRIGFRKLRLSNEEIEKYTVRNSDLIINRVNSIEYLGKCALVEDLTGNAVFESNIMRCCLIDDVVSKAYVAAYLASREGRNQLCKNAKHAVNQASINQTDVGNTLVPITFMEEQIVIVQKLEQNLSQTDALISQIKDHLKKADALRQSILKKAFSGELVPQEPDDEPASRLLERIRTEKGARSQNNSRTRRRHEKATA